ncbi:hypothetical protein AVEN_94309-1 [Araneus ventricosus]|uniref:PiggyBac transposable element-derived protein domain-containing protein n=1 Tax=Araneus ventricosus TaxID=182803 RepID=A0A4Y2QHD0_ARAVE|nr:hypothetical protein AVEN_94309-1 [Araneus ventricosus]
MFITWKTYCGKKDNVPRSEKGLGYDVIHFLCSCLKSTGHHIFFDRFFSIVLLMRDLFNAGQYSTGTIMLNRKFHPENIKEFKLKTAGKSKCFQCIETPDLTCIIWKDKKEITLVSTANKYTIESTKRRIGGNVASIPCPLTIRQYNKFMGGVDLTDQKRQYYDVARKTIGQLATPDSPRASRPSGLSTTRSEGKRQTSPFHQSIYQQNLRTKR